MKFKAFIFSTLLFCGISLAPRVEAQNITNFGTNVGFGPGVDPGNTWTYNGTTSTASGTNSNGNVLFGTFGPEVDFSGSNQISLTATMNAPGAPDSSFLFTLIGQGGATASAVFSWTNFLTPGTTMTAPLTPIVPGTMQNVNYWQIVSLYNDGSPALPINVTFANANASAGTVPSPGIGGPILTGFGANATASGSWNYTGSTISGNTSYGDSISGASSITSYAGATQVSLTASANVAQGTPFTYLLTDNTGEHAYAAFNWANFNGGVKTVTSQLNTDPFFDPTNVQSWQILSGAPAGTVVNATLYGAAAVSPTQVATPVDDFSVGISTINVNSGNPSALVSSTVDVGGFAGATRNVQAFSTGTSQLQLQINGGALSVAAINPSGPEVAQATLLYSGFTLYSPDQTFLRFDFNAVENLTSLDVELLSANGAFPIGGLFSVPDSTGAFSFFVDLTKLSGWSPEFMAGIKQATFGFGATTPNYFFTLDKVSFTAVPEPSTYALVVVGLVAVFVCRHRTRAGRRFARDEECLCTGHHIATAIPGGLPIIALATICLSAATARSAVVFDTMTTGTPYNPYMVYSDGPDSQFAAQAFSIADPNTRIDSIALGFGYYAGSSSLTVRIVPNLPGFNMPDVSGAVSYTLFSGSVDQAIDGLNQTLQLGSSNWATPIVLAPGMYWVVPEPAAGAFFIWYHLDDPVPQSPPLFNAYWNPNNGVESSSASTAYPYTMKVEATVLPEPATWVLCALGLGLCCFGRLRSFSR